MSDMSNGMSELPVKRLLQDLNESQREAVTHGDGPLLVFAGAGSGKTRVLTYRIAYLLAIGVVEPRNILAVTFTNKAANEMKERIANLIGAASRDIWAGTFHSTCARILRIDGSAIGIERDFVIFDDDDQIGLIKECLDQLGLSDKTFQPRLVLSQISHAKERLVWPDEFPKSYRGDFEQTVGRIYVLYQKKLQLNKALDFDDLIAFTVRLFQQRPDVLEKYQTRFKHILVDEYQDINHAQYMFIKLLAEKHKNVCVVGDDDQSIYKWRGADVGIILDFERDYPDAKVVKLEQNYRSTKNILAAAYHVIRRNQSRAEKELWTENQDGCLVSVHTTGNEQEEASWVGRKISEKVMAEGRSYSDFAILYRVNAQSRVFEEYLLSARIPHILIGTVRFYERREIRDLVAYLRLANNPLESVSLKRIMNVPPRGIGPSTFTAVEDFAAEKGIPLMEAVRRAEEIEGLQQKAKRGLTELAKLVEFLSDSKEKYPITRLLTEIIENTGYLRYLQEEKKGDAQARVENVRELLSVTTDFDAHADDKSLTTFLEQVTLMTDLDAYDEASDAVMLMTLHSAKGLEFPIVFIVGMEEGMFPHSRALRDDEELEEERRLCYVGMTRSKEELHLVHANQRLFMGTTTAHPRSRFVQDIPINLIQQEGVRRMEPTSWGTTMQARSLARSAAIYKPGDKVIHQKFGKGVVINATGTVEDGEVTVVFEADVGIKKLSTAYAKLERA